GRSARIRRSIVPAGMRAAVMTPDQSANTPTGAPTAGAGQRNRPPRVGYSASTSAGFPSRNEVTYMKSPAKQGMVGPGTGNGSFRSNLPSGEKQLMHPADGPADQ